MKVGLLECDHVNEDLISIAGDYREMFPALFLPLAPDWQFVFYDVCNGHFPQDVSECEVYICTGSRFSVYDHEDWIRRLISFVKEIHGAGRIFIGVCFGHQLIGEALGGAVRKSDSGWCIGVHDFELIGRETWMSPFEANLKLLMMCQDQVMVLPPNSKLLAKSKKCPNALFTVGDNVLGIQAHPEFSKDYNRALMQLRADKIGMETVSEGLESLDNVTHELTFAKWVVNFVNQKLNS